MSLFLEKIMPADIGQFRPECPGVFAQGGEDDLHDRRAPRFREGAAGQITPHDTRQGVVARGPEETQAPDWTDGARAVAFGGLPRCCADARRAGIRRPRLIALDLGMPPRIPVRGGMPSDARSYMSGVWWMAILPGLAIFRAVPGLNLPGDARRYPFDPDLKTN
ncbi:hypothetical protein HUK65_14040 [Rhodobacteraceae bacterium 2376]|uniref:Uncharacterized protein n=1 Tax=Rhabdonatronobacter sediminivivens TaxID=2743469 RepID=A0A7Z0I1H3_9RHOB|nr:hypothetical protein [Rhabdonatronobacter sediminivivens]NYS26110.1 hypothetical protein [Rhabdonatronobacter sediminivivens]